MVLAISVLLSRQWFFTTNQGYEYIRFQDENTVSMGIMLTNDIQNFEGYSQGTPVAFAGSSAPSAFQYRTGDFMVIHGEDGIAYTGYNDAIIDGERLKMLLRNWIGVSFQYVDADQLLELNKNPSVVALPVYPAHGSIALIDNVVVVKLSNCGG